MAAAYEKEFGKKLTLSRGIENAGYEWIEQILKNNVVLTSSDGSVSAAVGAAGQTNAPLGLCIASSKIRDNKKGQNLQSLGMWNPNSAYTRATICCSRTKHLTPMRPSCLSAICSEIPAAARGLNLLRTRTVGCPLGRKTLERPFA